MHVCVCAYVISQANKKAGKEIVVHERARHTSIIVSLCLRATDITSCKDYGDFFSLFSRVLVREIRTHHEQRRPDILYMHTCLTMIYAYFLRAGCLAVCRCDCCRLDGYHTSSASIHLLHAQSK